MKQKLKKAFTLVELVIVIAVIAILALVVVPSFSAITKNSDISADQDEVLALNFALAMYESDYGIYSEGDLQKAIDSSKGKNAYYSLKPLSANYGYHYWYKISNNKIYLATTQEIKTMANEGASINSDLNVYRKNPLYGNQIKTFQTDSLRSKLVPGFILLDRAGSDIAVGLSAIDDIISGRSTSVKDSYQTAINSIYNISNGKAHDAQLQGTLISHIQQTAFITNDGTLRFPNLEYAVDFVFQNDLHTVTSNHYYYRPVNDGTYEVYGNELAEVQPSVENAVISTSQTVSYDILPSITEIQKNSLWFKMAESTMVTLNMDLAITDNEDLVSIFAPSATNAQIYLPSVQKTYVIENNELKLNGETVALLGEIVKVENFDIAIKYGENTVTEIANKVKLVKVENNYKLFITGDYQESITLTAQNVLPENATSKKVLFTGGNESVATVTTQGEITVKLPEVGQNCATTVKATAISGGVTKDIDIEVIRVNQASLDFGDSESTAYKKLVIDKEQSETVEIEYDGSISELYFGELAQIVYSNNSSGLTIDTTLDVSVVSGDESITIETDGESGNKKVVINSGIMGDRVLVFTVKVGVYLEKTFTLKVIDSRVNTFKRKFENTNDYIYRVGNQNQIKLGSLFEINEELTGVTLKITDGIFDTSHDLETETANGFKANYVKNVTPGANYVNDIIKFSGTGIAKLTLTDSESHTLSLTVEVVNAKNVTSYSELQNTNCVLLNDITMANNSAYYLSNATLYGNGFTFDAKKGRVTGKGMLSENYIVCISDATLDNVKIQGAVYTTYGVQTSDMFNNALVYSVGNSVIANSYLSNCATPLRVNGGSLYVTDTTLKGGSFSNLDIRNNSEITVNNLTTINQADSNDQAVDGSIPVGLGITFYYENASQATLAINGTLKQYNHVCESDANALKNRYSGNSMVSNNLSKAIGELFGSGYEGYQYVDGNGTKWVNTGILVLNETTDVNDDGYDDRITYGDNVPNYVGKKISYTFIGDLFNNGTYGGYLYAPSKLVAPESAIEYQTVGQYATKPSYGFIHGDSVTNDNGRSYFDNDLNKVMIFINSEKTFAWSPSALNAIKYGKKLDYQVRVETTAIDGVTYDSENQLFNFTKAGEYRIIYSFTDTFNYRVNLENYEKHYNDLLVVDVTVIIDGAQKAVFAFGEQNPVETVINGKTYLSAQDLTTAVTVAGQTVYAQNVAMQIDSGNLFGYYAYFPVFGNAITITDNDNLYNNATTVMPNSLSVVGDPSEIFKYQSASSAESLPVIYNDTLCFKSPQISANRKAYSTIVEYVYTDMAGYVYHYFVNYWAEAKEFTSCFTANTLITLADGSQKAISNLEKTDKILAWDFIKGEYVAQDIALLVNHGKCAYNVVNLTFEGGYSLEIIGEHGVFNYDLNKYVYISELNAKNFIGNHFVKNNNAGGYDIVKLISFTVETKQTEAWSITSACTANAFASGMLTVAPPNDFYNWIEMGDKLRYDLTKLESDVKTYGLYTYETFKNYVTYEQFIAFNGAYLKIPVLKGIFEFDYIIELIKTYL